MPNQMYQYKTDHDWRTPYQFNRLIYVICSMADKHLEHPNNMFQCSACITKNIVLGVLCVSLKLIKGLLPKSVSEISAQTLCIRGLCTKSL